MRLPLKLRGYVPGRHVHAVVMLWARMRKLWTTCEPTFLLSFLNLSHMPHPRLPKERYRTILEKQLCHLGEQLSRLGKQLGHLGTQLGHPGKQLSHTG